MDCFKLNEVIYKKIENALEIPKAERDSEDQTYYKSIYGPATLMNDWYEKRIGKQVEVTLLEPPLSENMDKYRQICKSSYPDRAEYFTHTFDNYGLGQELLLDHSGFLFYDNYATSYDLMYNHLKKGICGPFPRHYFKGHYMPETDLTNVYGNLTQWGLKEEIYKQMKLKTCNEGLHVSETLAEFKPHNLNVIKKFNDFPNFKKIKVIY